MNQHFSTGWRRWLGVLESWKRDRRRARRRQFHRRLRIETIESRCLLATTYTVDTLVDELDGSVTDGDVSLRDAVAVAQAGDTIDFAPAIDGGTITLDRAFLGEIGIDKSLTIDASALDNGITIDADDPTPGRTGDGIRIFNITDPSGGTTPPIVTLDGLTLTGGDVNGRGGAVFSAGLLVVRNVILKQNQAFEGEGGAIFAKVLGTGSREVLRIEDSILEFNDANGGGAVAVVAGSSSQSTSDKITITRTAITDNDAHASPFGGGVYADLFGAELVIDRTTFLRNEVLAAFGDGNGGGLRAILRGGNLTIDASRFEQNETARDGAGAYVEMLDGAIATISDTAFDTNEAGDDGGGLYVTVPENGSLDIRDSSFVSNRAALSPPGAGVPSEGGGVFVQVAKNASLTIADSVISGNQAVDGGGIMAQIPGPPGYYSADGSVVSIERSTIADNRATGRGGGLFTAVGAGGQVTVQESVISGNDAGVDLLTPVYGSEIPHAGGGIYGYLFSSDLGTIGSSSPASLTITGTEVSENRAGEHGGGITICAKRISLDPATSPTSRLTVSNSTISGNQAGHTTTANIGGTGGGVHLAIFDAVYAYDERLDSQFNNTTITGNTADTGGGIYSLLPTRADGRNNTSLSNTIASGNQQHDGSPNNLHGSFNIPETVYNIIGSGGTVYDYVTHSGASLNFPPNIASDNAGLAPLAFYGGSASTRTHVPLATSPAVDAGDPAIAFDPNAFDQRGSGFVRVRQGRIDIGAAERGPAPRVVDVTIRSSTTGGSYRVPAENQLGSVPLARPDEILVTFDEPVTVTANAAVVQGVIVGQVKDYTVTQTAPSANTASWKLASGQWFSTDMANNAGDQVALMLDHTKVTSGTGALLDGDWTNPRSYFETDGTDYLGNVVTETPDSTFPSGDGAAGGDFEFHFVTLPGDLNQDSEIDLADYTILVEWATRPHGTVGVAGGYENGDVDGNGLVEEIDYDILKENYGTILAMWTWDLTLGDLNLSGLYDFDDITPFVEFLNAFETYISNTIAEIDATVNPLHPVEYQITADDLREITNKALGDFDGNDRGDFDDLDGFVTGLSQPFYGLPDDLPS